MEDLHGHLDPIHSGVYQDPEEASPEVAAQQLRTIKVVSFVERWAPIANRVLWVVLAFCAAGIYVLMKG